MTSRELVRATLEFRNTDDRAPRQLWCLPWARDKYGREVNQVNTDFPDDIVSAPHLLKTQCQTKGDPYAKGEYIDEWGCVFENIHPGVIGEVKHPIVAEEDEDWEDLSRIHIPREWLTLDTEGVNAFCRSTDKFVLTPIYPRPFEQLQFIRTTELFYMDLMMRPAGLMNFMKAMHSFYCDALELWCAKTEVDGIQFMDDWGAQKALLIHPDLWKELFWPMYKDYIDIAHRHGKKAFMHSDGNILAILPYLIESGLDAVNSQIFCMGVENLKDFKGKITFWGEMDRQHLLVESTPKEIALAVKRVKETLWQNGGCIAQCEFGPGGKPENIYETFRAWNLETKGEALL